jgi:lysozyme
VRRWLAAAVALLVAAALLGRYVWLPRYRPSLRAGESYGVDVSHHQGPVDWPRVAGDGIAFAYVKATEGATHTDTRFAANWAGARDAGLRRGAYHFFTLCTPGADQARHFLATVPDLGELPPAVDLELAGNCAARPPAADVAREVAAFLRPVEERAGRPVLRYVGADFADRYGVAFLGDRPAWVPRPLRRPGGGWAVWQASAWARVAGIDGGVDLDVGRADFVGGPR